MYTYTVAHALLFPLVLIKNYIRRFSFINWPAHCIIYGLALFSCLLPVAVMASNNVTFPGKILSSADFNALKLRGVNISSQNQLNETDFQSLASSGAQLVRVGITLNRCSTCSEYEISARDLAYVKQVVAFGKTLGFYVVVAMQPLPAGNQAEYWDNPKLQNSIMKKWQTIASIFRDEPIIAGYDLLNEPVPRGINTASQESTWIKFANQLSSAIRSTDQEHAIIVEVAPWDLPSGFSQLAAPLPFPNLVYSLHFYDPHQVTHQGLNNYRATVQYPSDAQSGIGVWDKARLSSLLEPVRQFSRRYQVPIYVGEFSCIRWAPNGSAYRYIKDLTELFDAEGWSWTYHQYRGWNGWDAEIPSPDPANSQRTTDSPIFTLLHNEFQRGQ